MRISSVVAVDSFDDRHAGAGDDVDVIAIAALERGGHPGGERIGVVRAGHRLDRGEVVALGIAAGVDVGVQVDVDGVRGGIVDRVVARAAVDDVGGAVADEGVAVIGAADGLDGIERIARREPGAQARQQVDRHGAGGVVVVDRVGPGAAEELVGAVAARQGIVAGIAEQHVGAVSAEKALTDIN